MLNLAIFAVRARRHQAWITAAGTPRRSPGLGTPAAGPGSLSDFYQSYVDYTSHIGMKATHKPLRSWNRPSEGSGSECLPACGASDLSLQTLQDMTELPGALQGLVEAAGNRGNVMDFVWLSPIFDLMESELTEQVRRQCYLDCSYSLRR